MTKQIERLVKRFNEVQKRANNPNMNSIDARWLRELVFEEAFTLAVAVSKHVAAQAKRKEKADVR